MDIEITQLCGSLGCFLSLMAREQLDVWNELTLLLATRL
jgi:hypothetical protein